MKQETRGRKKVRRFGPYLVYVLSIDGKFYVGCHTKKPLTITQIKIRSGNPLHRRVRDGFMSQKEYSSRASVCRIEECNSEEEALNLEGQMIQEYKNLFGDDCINIALYGNKYANLGVVRSQEIRERISRTVRETYKSQELRNEIGRKVKLSKLNN